MTSSRACPKGHPVDTTDHFCGICGSTTTMKRFCSRGHEVAAEDLYCASCGLPTLEVNRRVSTSFTPLSDRSALPPPPTSSRLPPPPQGPFHGPQNVFVPAALGGFAVFFVVVMSWIVLMAVAR